MNVHSFSLKELQCGYTSNHTIEGLKVEAHLAVHQELALVLVHLVIPWIEVPALDNNRFNYHIAVKVLYLSNLRGWSCAGSQFIICDILNNTISTDY